MYENDLTNISLPDAGEFIYHLGVAICVFMSVNGFIIENIIRTDQQKSWYDLIDSTSGRLLEDIKNTITKNSNTDIAKQFEECICKRNRIIHGYRATDNKTQLQVIYTKDKKDQQDLIDDKFLLDFIKDCNKLNDMLNKYRDNSVSK